MARLYVFAKDLWHTVRVCTTPHDKTVSCLSHVATGVWISRRIMGNLKSISYLDFHVCFALNCSMSDDVSLFTDIQEVISFSLCRFMEEKKTKHQHRITVCCITQTITVNGIAGGKWSAFIQKVVEHTIQTFFGGEGFPPNKVLKVILQCFKGTLSLLVAFMISFPSRYPLWSVTNLLFVRIISYSYKKFRLFLLLITPGSIWPLKSKALSITLLHVPFVHSLIVSLFCFSQPEVAL